MNIENVEADNKNNSKSNNSQRLIIDTSSIPSELGGTFGLRTKTLRVFCVNDFSIQDEKGNFISLASVSNPRVPFEKPLYLKGNVVCPFEDKVYPEISPLMRVKERSKRSKRSATVIPPATTIQQEVNNYIQTEADKLNLSGDVNEMKVAENPNELIVVDNTNEMTVSNEINEPSLETSPMKEEDQKMTVELEEQADQSDLGDLEELTCIPESVESSPTEKVSNVSFKHTTVLSFGKIIPTKNFYTQKMIYPVGYKSRKLYWSIYHLDEKIYYICEICTVDDESPLFCVYPEDHPETRFEATTTGGAWRKVLNTIAKIRKRNGVRETSICLSGPEMFGFTNPDIIAAIEDLQGADECCGYIPYYERSMKKKIPQEDGENDDDDSGDFFTFSISDNDEKDETVEFEDIPIERPRRYRTRKPIHKARVGKDTFLRVQLMKVKNGYEVIKSELDDIANPTEKKNSISSDVKLRRSRKDRVNIASVLNSYDSEEEEEKVKKPAVTATEPKKDIVKQNEVEANQPKKKVRRLHSIEGKLFGMNFSGSFHLGFKTVGKPNDSHVFVRPSYNPFFNDRNLKTVIHKIIDIINYDLKYKEIGHLLRILYCLRLLKIKEDFYIASGLEDCISKLTTCGISTIEDEAFCIQSLFKNQVPYFRKRAYFDLLNTETNEMNPEGSVKRGKVFSLPSYYSIEKTYTKPVAETPSQVKISIQILQWGIKYHYVDSFLYVQSTDGIFILRGNSVKTSPSKSYYSYFLREKRLFEICQQIFKIYREMQAEGKDFQYEEIVSQLWNNNLCDDVLIVEEDLIMEYPFISKEMKDLDKDTRYVNMPYYFGMNDFMENIKFHYDIWKKQNENLDYVYALENDLSLAHLRSDLLNFDQYIVGAVAQDVLPPANIPIEPKTYPFHSDILTGNDWKQLIEIWYFIQNFASLLDIPAGEPILLQKSLFFNESSTKETYNQFVLNAYEIFIKYLTNEQVKRDTSLRKQMRDVNWVMTGIFSIKKNVSLCDYSNFDAYIRGYFDPFYFSLEFTNDVIQRLHYIIIMLMRHPDCADFLHPIDEVKQDVPGYNDIIKKPMDFQTICNHLMDGWYFSEEKEEGTSRGCGIKGVIEDILLIYTNCRLYHGSDSTMYRYCQKLTSLTEALVKQWIAPLDESVNEVFPNRSTERDDSDDETSRRSKSKNSNTTPTIHYDHSILDPILEHLRYHDIQDLPFKEQIQILFALYSLVLETSDIKNESIKRENACKQLQQEYTAIINQLHELKSVFSKQEHDLRTNYITYLRDNKEDIKGYITLISPAYTPQVNSKYKPEVALAQFLTKRQPVLSDLIGQLKQTTSQLIATQKSCGKVQPLGIDRNQNEYYFFPYEHPTRLWLFNRVTEEWRYIWHPEEFNKLLKWLDNRGSDEQYLYSALCHIKILIKEQLSTNLHLSTILVDSTSLTEKRRRELSQEDLLLYKFNEKEELAQVSGSYFGIPKVDMGIPIERMKCRKSPILPVLSHHLFSSLFSQQQDPIILQIKNRMKEYDNRDYSLDEYKQLVLDLEEAIDLFVDNTFVYPDWHITRIYWREYIMNCQCYSDVNFYIGDLEINCVDFSIVDALSSSTDRNSFIQLYEESGKKAPRIPDLNEHVIYYSKGHEDAKIAFIRSNVLSGIFAYDEEIQQHNYFCKVVNIEYFWGRGNPFIRLTLRTVTPSFIKTLVQSYYDCLSQPSFRITNVELSEENPNIQFTCTVWLETTDSSFVIPFDIYANAISNNLHVGDHFRMWFYENDTKNNSNSRRKDAKGNGFYSYGKVLSIKPLEDTFFPWECIEVKWDSNTTETGINFINPWECEFDEKRSRNKVQENKPVFNNETHKLTDDEIKEIHKKAKEIVKNHKKEDGEDFFRFLAKYWADRGYEIQKPILSYDILDLGLFWELMQLFGGYENVVSTKGSWLFIYTILPNYRTSNTSAPTSLHRIYIRYLWQFEKEQREEKGLPPIGEPRLPVPTTPGKLVGGKTKSSMNTNNNSMILAEDEEKKDLILLDTTPGIQFLSKLLKEEEYMRSVISKKLQTIQFSLQYESGPISTMGKTIYRDYAYKGIVNGYNGVLKKQMECVSRIITQLRNTLRPYL